MMAKTGVGAAKQCDLPAGGFMRERVTEWQAGESYAINVNIGEWHSMSTRSSSRLKMG